MVQHAVRKVYLVLPVGKGVGKRIALPRAEPVPTVEIEAHSRAETAQPRRRKPERDRPPAGALYTERPVEPVPFGVAQVAVEKVYVVFLPQNPYVAADKFVMQFHAVSPPSHTFYYKGQKFVFP